MVSSQVGVVVPTPTARLVTPPAPSVVEYRVRSELPSILALYDSTTPDVVVATGKSIQETIPASVSKLREPRLILSIEVMPEEVSYSRAPESREKPPTIVVVALPPALAVVSILKMGVADDEVAMVQAKLALCLMVEVEVTP